MDSVQKTIEKVQLFSALPPGWCQGYEIPPSPETIFFACEVIKKISQFGLHIDAFPGDEDSVRISVLKGDHSVDFDVHKNSFLSLIEEKGIGFQYEELDYKENPSLSEILKKIFSISKLNQQAWSVIRRPQEMQHFSYDVLPVFVSTVTTYKIGEMMETDSCLFASLIQENTIPKKSATTQTASNYTEEAFPYLKKNAQKNITEPSANTYLNAIQQSAHRPLDTWKYPKNCLPVAMSPYASACR